MTGTFTRLYALHIYSADGRLMAEADGAGVTVREYIWLDDLPLAVVNRSGTANTVFFVHAGHRAEPLVVTNSSRAKVWDAAYEPFGLARIFTSTVELNLRLPGQQLQAETGLHQNWMRDYDPILGRYAQPDPIGLSGGPNVYGYVGQDPLNFVDPRGEIWVQAGGIIGGAVVGGVASIAGDVINGRPVNPSAAWTGAATGALNGLLVTTTPLGFSVAGVVTAGAGTNALGFVLQNPPPLPGQGQCPIPFDYGSWAGGLAFTAALGGLGGALGGPLKPMVNPRPIRLAPNDIALGLKAVSPPTIAGSFISNGIIPGVVSHDGSFSQ